MFRKSAALVALALAFASSSCDDESDSAPSPAAIVVEGTVAGGAPLAGSDVAFVEAAAVAASNSLQPLEDLAPRSSLHDLTDESGRFAIAIPPGRYFILVTPPAGNTTHLPGGQHARGSIDIAAAGMPPLELRLSEVPSAGASHVGSSRCLGCHPSLGSHAGTLHAVGLRKLGPQGSEPSSLQDLASFPDADAGLAFFADGNSEDNTGAGDGFGYRIAGGAYNVLLGRNDGGFFQVIESLDGARRSSPLAIELTYGGEGLFRQLFATRLGAEPAQASRYFLPGQFSETRGDAGRPRETALPGWVLHEPESWAPPVADGGPPALVPAAARSFDARCAGCHFNGMSLERNGAGLFQARAVADRGGSLDYDGDGSVDEINVGCEGCHGPGSEHVAQPGRRIVHPGRLSSGGAGLVCGRCHIRGSGNGTIDGEGGTEYPSRNGADGVELAPPGVGPAEFFGQSDGGGILPDFGTRGGFLDAIDLRQDAGSWMDAAAGFGESLDHSRGSMQHYFDHARSGHAANSRLLLACWDCHDPHAREGAGQLREPAANNVLCLRCHSGRGDFAAVTTAMVDEIASTGTSAREVSSAIHEHVKLRSFDLVGVSMNLGPDVYSNPAGEDRLGRCVTCHMPKTAASGGWVGDDEGFLVRGDISSHTFDNVSPGTSEAMAGAGLEAVPNSCVECHRGTLRGAWPDYRFQRE